MAKGFLLATLFFLCATGLLAQPALVDSIETLLATTEQPDQRMDLLLGLCRARVFSEGGGAMKPNALRALAYARETGNEVGEGNALLFDYMSEYVVERGLEISTRAYELGRKNGDRNLEIFATYHLIEHYHYDKNDLENSQRWIEQGLSRLTPEVYHKHRGNLYKDTGLFYQSLGNADSTLYYSNLALAEFNRVAEDISPTLGRAPSTAWANGDLNACHVLMSLSDHYTATGNFARADSCLNEARIRAERWKADNLISRVHEGYGKYYATTGDIARAIDAYSEALKIHEEQGALNYLTQTARAIGDLFSLAKDPAVAMSYYQRALAGASEIKDSVEMSLSLIMLGRASRQLGVLDDSRDYLGRGLAITEQMGDSITMGAALSDLALTSLQANELEEAEANYRLAIVLQQKFNNQQYLLSSYANLSRTLLRSGQLDSASRYAALANEKTYAIGGPSERRTIHALNSDLAEARGDLSTALSERKLYEAYTDSLFSQSGQQSLRQEQVRQRVADYQRETETAERERTLLAQRTNLYLALAGALFLLLLIGGLLFLKLRSTRQVLAARNLELMGLNATKDRFFSIIAHDIRSPITALDGVSEQLRYNLEHDRPEKALSLTDRIDSTAKRLTSLLDNLLNWALSQQGMIPHHPQTLQVGDIVEEVAATFLPAAEGKGISLDHGDPADRTIFADSPALHTILRNLVSNALKFTPRGGSVWLTYAGTPQTTAITVHDDGIGFSPEARKKLFSLTTASSRGTAGERGSGLGLLLVRELLELNGGTLKFKSEPGEGSSFTLNLPARG